MLRADATDNDDRALAVLGDSARAHGRERLRHGEEMATESEEHVEDWSVSEPENGIVRVTHKPSGERFEMTVADVRGTKPGENEVWAGHLDDYLRRRAINIAAQRKLVRLEQ
jgi:hypothetical protein